MQRRDLWLRRVDEVAGGAQVFLVQKVRMVESSDDLGRLSADRAVWQGRRDLTKSVKRQHFDLLFAELWAKVHSRPP